MKHQIQDAGTPSSALVFTIIHLCGAEGGRGNVEDSMVHLRGTRDILNILGEPAVLEETTWHILAGIDGYRAVQLMQNPLFPCYFDPGDAHRSFAHLPELTKNLRSFSRVDEGHHEISICSQN